MKAYPVTVLCRVMRVSRSGLSDYLHRCESASSMDDLSLTAQIKCTFRQSGSTYGSRRMVRQLQADGYKVGRYKVRRIMRELGLEARRPRRYKVTTDSRHSFPVAPNILNRQFEVAEPNRAWCADITYVWTLAGWLYLAVVMDLFSRQIIGWAMEKNMTKQLVMDALSMALWRRKPAAGLLHHSDRGSQYACHDYRKLLRDWQIVPSMSRRGDCWDNAPMERFFGSLKSERLDYCRFADRMAAKMEILDYITFYNANRLHSTLGYKSPMDYEKEQLMKVA
jgi:transposase InsO family protein